MKTITLRKTINYIEMCVLRYDPLLGPISGIFDKWSSFRGYLWYKIEKKPQNYDWWLKFSCICFKILKSNLIPAFNLTNAQFYNFIYHQNPDNFQIFWNCFETILEQSLDSLIMCAFALFDNLNSTNEIQFKALNGHR